MNVHAAPIPIDAASQHTEPGVGRGVCRVPVGLPAGIHRRRMGPAVWLWLLLRTKQTDSDGTVSDGQPLTARALGSQLDLRDRQIRQYLGRLAESGYCVLERRREGTAVRLLPLEAGVGCQVSGVRENPDAALVDIPVDNLGPERQECAGLDSGPAETCRSRAAKKCKSERQERAGLGDGGTATSARAGVVEDSNSLEKKMLVCLNKHTPLSDEEKERAILKRELESRWAATDDKLVLAVLKACRLKDMWVTPRMVAALLYGVQEPKAGVDSGGFWVACVPALMRTPLYKLLGDWVAGRDRAEDYVRHGTGKVVRQLAAAWLGLREE